MRALPAVVATLEMFHIKAISISGVLGVRANLTSWRERTSVRKGHKVKQIMCSQYQAVIRWYFTVVLLFALTFLMGLFIPGPGFSFFLPPRTLRCCRCWSLFGPRLRSPWPRARPPACDSTVSTNAFRAELHAFSGVSQAAASADCNQIQSGIKRRSWHLTPSKENRES